MKGTTRWSLAAALLLLAPPPAAAQWPQWGGPERDFRVADPGLAAAWPAAGLEPLWTRPLGEGYAGITAVGGRLYTQYGDGEEEVVVALSAADGTELWAHRHAAPRPDGMRLNHGEGPHATPLVSGGRVFAVGTTGQLVALDADSGRLLWRRDLWGEYGGYRLRRGYGASPLAWGETVIVPVGGDGPGVVAFAGDDGRVVWQSPPFDSAQSSPMVIQVDGVPQLVLFIQDEVVAVDPGDGSLVWRHPHKAFGPYNISTPVWADGTLFVSSSYGGGSRLLRPSADAVAELWHSKKMGIQFTNALRIGGAIYGSTGRGSAMLAALDAASGELLWRDRAVGRANYLLVGERVLALEAGGRLLLLELSRRGVEVLAAAPLLDSQSWTAPTLVDRTLFVRDRERILAVELPAAGPPGLRR